MSLLSDVFHEDKREFTTESPDNRLRCLLTNYSACVVERQMFHLIKVIWGAKQNELRAIIKLPLGFHSKPGESIYLPSKSGERTFTCRFYQWDVIVRSFMCTHTSLFEIERLVECTMANYSLWRNLSNIKINNLLLGNIVSLSQLARLRLFAV